MEPAEKKTEKLVFEPFLFDISTPKENTVLSIDFLQNEIRCFYEVEFNHKAIVKEALKFSNFSKSTAFTRTTDVKNQFAEIKFGGKIKVEKTALKTLEANTLWNNTVLGGYLKTNIEIKELKELSDWFKGYLHSLVFPKSDHEMFIASLIDDNKIKKEYNYRST